MAKNNISRRGSTLRLTSGRNPKIHAGGGAVGQIAMNIVDAYKTGSALEDESKFNSLIDMNKGLDMSAGTFDELSTNLQNIKNIGSFTTEDVRAGNPLTRTLGIGKDVVSSALLGYKFGDSFNNSSSASAALSDAGKAKGLFDGAWKSKLGNFFGTGTGIGTAGAAGAAGGTAARAKMFAASLAAGMTLTSALLGNRKGNNEGTLMAGVYNNRMKDVINHDLASAGYTADTIQNTMKNQQLTHLSALGGPLFANGGTMDHDFLNGLSFVNAGGTHEENPNMGIMVGQDEQGNPDLVEEGEVIYNDYVYSNRLSPTKELLESVGLSNRFENKTFAYIAEKLSKEYQEKPNDPIAIRTFNDSMNRLQQISEQVRMQEEQKKQAMQQMQQGVPYDFTMSANGGRLYVGGGNEVSKLNLPDFDTTLLSYLSSPENTSINSAHNLKEYRNRLAKLAALSKAQVLFDEEDPSRVTVSGKENSDDVEDSNKSKNDIPLFDTSTRTAPIYGSALQVLSDLFGITNKPDYSRELALMSRANTVPRVKSTPIGGYYRRSLLPLNYYSTAIQNQLDAARRAAVGASGNQYQAQAAALASGFTGAGSISDALLKARTLQNQDDNARAAYSSDIDARNAASALQAMMQNQQSDWNAINTAANAYATMNTKEMTADGNKAGNRSNLAGNLGALGKENAIYNMINRNPALAYAYLSRANDIGYKAANGGMLTRKKRK